MTPPTIDENHEAPLDAEREAQISDALQSSRDFFDDEIARSVHYVAMEDLFILVLRSGRRILIPREELQPLAKASPAAAGDMSLEMLNSAVSWKQLDVDISVRNLAQGVWGNQAWMSHLSRRDTNAQAA